MNTPPNDSPDLQAALEAAAAQTGQEQYVLRLVIAGTTHRSNQAVANLKAICDQYLPGRYELEIIDIYQQPELAAGLQVIAAPTLVKKRPLPLRKLVGNLSEVDRILLALGLLPTEKKDSSEDPEPPTPAASVRTEP